MSSAIYLHKILFANLNCTATINGQARRESQRGPGKHFRGPPSSGKTIFEFF